MLRRRVWMNLLLALSMLIRKIWWKSSPLAKVLVRNLTVYGILERLLLGFPHPLSMARMHPNTMMLPLPARVQKLKSARSRLMASPWLAPGAFKTVSQ